MARPKVILLDNNTAYLPGTRTAITISNRSMIADPAGDPIKVDFDDKKLRRVVPWGSENDLPQKVLESCYKSPIVTAGMSFNTSCAYGDGICYGRWKVDEKAGKHLCKINP